MKAIHQNSRITTIKFFAIIALLFFTTQQAKAVCNLQAGFTYVEGISNIVEFTNTTVGANSLHWDFGNGATSTVFNPTIQFQQDAFYNVCLIATDSNSCVDTTCHSLTIGAPCFHNNPIINYVIDITDSISQICSYGGGNCFQDNFIILDSANNGIITQSGINCFLYKPQSLGVDTIRVITCSLPILPNNCDTTTHIINIILPKPDTIWHVLNCIGCSDNICLNLHNNSASPTFCDGNRSGIGNNVNYSFNNMGCITFTANSLGSDTTCVFQCDTVNNICFNTVVMTNVDTTQSLCDTTTCLLPGDSDHDLTVNNYDALAIGLSYNRTGNTRPNATTQYNLQACPDWNTTHYYGYNDKFADCNGDGRINSLDAVVISQNYIAQAQNYFNHRQSNLDSLPAVTLVFDTLPTTVVNGNCDGAEIVADILVGSAAQPIINGYGVAFSVNYPFENDTCFNVQVDLDPNSWLQTNNPVLLFYKDIPQFKRVDISVVRTDGLPRSGNGRIGKIKMITEGAVFRNGLRLSTPPIFDFSVTDVAAINHIGQRIDVNGSTTTVSFIVLGTIKNKVDGLKFYPNPTTGKIYINAKETIQSIRIIDTQGRIIDELSINKNDIQVDISTVESGMYILEIKGNNSVSYEKIFKQ